MIGENIRALRKQRGVSQEELAAELNVVRQTISKWEKGLSSPNSEMLVLIADFFEIPVESLLEENKNETDKNNDELPDEKPENLYSKASTKNERNRKILRCVFFILGSASLLILILSVIALLLPIGDYGNIATIGGADGPTAIFVSAIDPKLEWFLVIVAVLITAIAGIILTRKK